MVYGYARVSTDKQILNRQIENIIRAYPDVKIYAETYTGTTDERPKWQKLLNVIEKGDTIVCDSVSRMSRNKDEGIKEYFHLYDLGVDLVFLNEPYINTSVYRQAISNSLATVGNEIADIYIQATNKVLKLLAKQQIQQAFEQSEKEVKDLKKRTSEGMKSKGASNKWLKDDQGKDVLNEHNKRICLKQGSISKTRTGKKYETTRSKAIKNIILSKSTAFGGTMKDVEIIAMLNGKYSKIRNGKKTDLSSTYYKYKRRLLEESGQISGQLQIDLK